MVDQCSIYEAHLVGVVETSILASYCCGHPHCAFRVHTFCVMVYLYIIKQLANSRCWKAADI